MPRVMLFLIIPFTLYLIGLNNFLAPETYDEVLYMEGAQSIAKGEGYRSMGEHIVDWPPLMSTYLSVPMMLGWTSVYVAKLQVLLLVIAAIIVLHHLLKQEKRPHPVLTCFLFLLLPASLIVGTRVMTEWPFLFLTFLFLVLLNRIAASRGIGWAIFAGLLMAASLLTRYAGILLVVPTIVQAWQLRRDRKRGPWVEAVIVAIGVGVFAALWLVPMLLLRSSGEAQSKYYEDATAVVSTTEPSSLLTFTGDLFFQHLALVNLSFYPVMIGVVIVFLLLMLFGFVTLCRQRTLRPLDWYVIASLLVFVVHEGKYTRYLLPAAPFLIGYLFIGGMTLIGALKDSWRNAAKAVAACCLGAWILYIGVLDAYLLVNGNGRTYNGVSIWASSTPEDYYANDWHDLYVVCRAMKEDSLPGCVATYHVKTRRYVHYFSGRDVKEYAGPTNCHYILVSNLEPTPPEVLKEIKAKARLSLRTPAYSLYESR